MRLKKKKRINARHASLREGAQRLGPVVSLYNARLNRQKYNKNARLLTYIIGRCWWPWMIYSMPLVPEIPVLGSTLYVSLFCQSIVNRFEQTGV